MDIYATLKSLDITLPAVSTPAAAYVPFVQTGNLENRRFISVFRPARLFSL